MNSNLLLGFRSLETEVNKVKLELEGDMPQWLSGSLIRNGAAKFEVNDEKYNHWFDGLAMLHRFAFKNGKISYTNRFLRGNTYKKTEKAGRIIYPEFATMPISSTTRRMFLYASGRFTDNASVNVVRIDQSYLALTETPPRVEFDINTLATIGRFNFKDKIKGHLTTVHPHFDRNSGDVYNYITAFSLRSSYNIYKIERGSRERIKICTVPVKHPSYMHTFGMTEKYIILSQFPLFINPIKMVATGTALVENLTWKPEHGITFIVVCKKSGEVISTLRSEPFFAFHHINCFEQEDKVIVDLVAYENPDIIKAVYLDKLLTGDFTMPIPKILRFTLNLGTKEASYNILSKDFAEFPRINYEHCNTKDYSYVYGLMDHNSNGFLSKLVKINTRDQGSKYWHRENNFPGEPVFVPHPASQSEDDGVILSLVLDLKKGKSFLLILDGVTFLEIGRAYLPFAVPFGSHGQYFD